MRPFEGAAIMGENAISTGLRPSSARGLMCSNLGGSDDLAGQTGQASV
jgi:hypothetical protein